MDKVEILEGLNSYRGRLLDEVLQAFEERGRDYGHERFQTWRRKLSQFLDVSLAGETSRLKAKLQHFSILSRHRGESAVDYFWRQDGCSMLSYIDSLILDVENDEYDKHEAVVIQNEPDNSKNKEKKSDKVFIVHGHNSDAKEKTARFVEKLGFEAIILHEQASKSRTIIEKIEDYSNETDFAIVLYTPDDVGNVKTEVELGQLNTRARQNVVFEHGFLIGKLGRENVVPLVSGKVELPSDISGMVYISDQDWQIDIAKEMSAVGYKIDFNKLFS
ncbi:TIR domain-containing protein [Shewanella surugensis]|uniref:Nucleotide-binding protein n=1 Tax=Shewanella surugensis TaxID=212020 RepID=A0ABT0L6N1_9GAMM|nr:nucleotide-binding protein [Shewanella surugensis]MCL1123320.1 nucleotide-binding protein [Shewanella surugensis]